MSRPALAARGVDSSGADWRAAVDVLVTEFAELQARQAAFNTAARHLLTTLAGDPPAPGGPIGPLALPALLVAYERSLVLWALARTGGRQLDAARVLGVLPSTLSEKMKRLGIARSRQTAGVQAETVEDPAQASGVPRRTSAPHMSRPEQLRRRLA